MARDMSRISEDILHQSKNLLCSHIHSLILGVSKLNFIPIDMGAFTDGRVFCYDPENICRRYFNDRNSVNRLLLHSLLHCVLFHPFNTDFKDPELWNISCDIAVECTINKWNIACTASEKSNVQNNIIKEILSTEKNLTAENIYYRLLSEDREIVLSKAEMFLDDDHSIWYNKSNEGFVTDSEDMQTIELHSIYKRDDDKVGDTVSGDEETLTQKVNSSANEEQEAWRKIASHIVKTAEASMHLGYAPGIDVQLFKSLSQKRYDYSVFLKKFLTVKETIEINDDEFDYIFYTYGLKLYGDMPIVEPLEYAENSKIRKLFIAIDTSGSVKGDIVQGFMEKTFDILKSTDYFSRKCEIHILQCDSEIQNISVIRSEKELEQYINTVSLKGFGGTDFRPVFQYVSDICNKSGTDEINGLIYFTDGEGIYPSEMPVFRSVFAVHDNGFDKSKIPAWCTVIYIDKLDLIR